MTFFEMKCIILGGLGALINLPAKDKVCSTALRKAPNVTATILYPVANRENKLVYIKQFNQTSLTKHVHF